MEAMKGRSWIWKEFVSGLYETLEEEYQKNNLNQEQIYDFAKNLKIAPDAISLSIFEKNWSKLLSTLIAIIPREQKANRYRDM